MAKPNDLYPLIACMKNGIWDRKLRANTKTNIIVSLVGGTVVALLYFISSYLKYHKLLGSIATGIIMLSVTYPYDKDRVFGDFF